MAKIGRIRKQLETGRRAAENPNEQGPELTVTERDRLLTELGGLNEQLTRCRANRR